MKESESASLSEIPEQPDRNAEPSRDGAATTAGLSYSPMSHINDGKSKDHGLDNKTLGGAAAVAAPAAVSYVGCKPITTTAAMSPPPPPPPPPQPTTIAPSHPQLTRENSSQKAMKKVNFGSKPPRNAVSSPQLRERAEVMTAAIQEASGDMTTLPAPSATAEWEVPSGGAAAEVTAALARQVAELEHQWSCGDDSSGSRRPSHRMYRPCKSLMQMNQVHEGAALTRQ